MYILHLNKFNNKFLLTKSNRTVSAHFVVSQRKTNTHKQTRTQNENSHRHKIHRLVAEYQLNFRRMPLARCWLNSGPKGANYHRKDLYEDVTAPRDGTMMKTKLCFTARRHGFVFGTEPPSKGWDLPLLSVAAERAVDHRLMVLPSGPMRALSAVNAMALRLRCPY